MPTSDEPAPGSGATSPRRSTSMTSVAASAYASVPTRIWTVTSPTGAVIPVARGLGGVAAHVPRRGAVTVGHGDSDVAQGPFEIVDELLARRGGARPVRLFGGQLVGRRTDLRHRGGDLLRGRALLLGREDALVEHRRCRAHQLADLLGLAR